MPTYDYVCENCSVAFEEFQSITAEPLKKCPKCGKKKLKRLIGAGAGIIFKGTGFYQTDYRSDNYKSCASNSANSNSSSTTAASSTTSTDTAKNADSTKTAEPAAAPKPAAETKTPKSTKKSA